MPTPLRLLRLVASAALLLTLTACSGDSDDGSGCGPDTCEGCCDARGECQAGTELAACGGGGKLCAACQDYQFCVEKACSDEPVCKFVNASCTQSSQCCDGLGCNDQGRCVASSSCQNEFSACDDTLRCCPGLDCENGQCREGFACGEGGQACVNGCCKAPFVCASGVCS